MPMTTTAAPAAAMSLACQPAPADLERAAALLGAHPDYKVIRALPPLDTLTLPKPEGKVRRILVIDTETTSLDRRTGRIIQIAACPVRIDGRGRIVAIGRTRSWLEDPGEPLSPEIARLTGLSDADLAGQRIDDAAVEALLGASSAIVAHNAGFDRPWWEGRYPVARRKPWACSLREVDWRGHGYEGRSLGTLLSEAAGWFNARHRADADVDALVGLLTATLPTGRTASSELFLTASEPSVRISARGAPYEAKDRLKQRGYRWAAEQRVWRIEVAEERQAAELAWLAAEAGCPGPHLEQVTWFDRHH